MDYIGEIRKKKPLIFNITNEVATNFAANGLLAIGASPAMSHTPKEADEFGRIANAVVLNLGTLTEDRAKAMFLAGKAANEAGVPVILDPIAPGATVFRTDVIHELLETVNFTIIRANASEIAVLGEALDKTNSPDSIMDDNDPEIAAAVARKYESVVISTGKTDVITDGTRTTICNNGVEMLPYVTASGCLLTSLVGAFSSIAEDMYHASIYATAGYGIAAELAMTKAEGPGSFKAALIDQLYFLNHEKINEHKDIQEYSFK